MVGVGNSNACVRARERENFVVIDLLMDKYNVAFCGDWFDLEGFGRIEGAILSALKLSFKISSLY